MDMTIRYTDSGRMIHIVLTLVLITFVACRVGWYWDVVTFTQVLHDMAQVAGLASLGLWRF